MKQNNNVTTNQMKLNLIPLQGNKELNPCFKAPACGVRDFNNPSRFKTHNTLAEPKVLASNGYFGILTGEANSLVVLDYDKRKESKKGTTPENLGKIVDDRGKEYTFEALKNIYGDDAHIVRTQSGGFHVYCALDERVKHWRNGQNIQGCLDIRATGGYVVGAGSPEYEVMNGDIGSLTSVPNAVFDIVNPVMLHTDPYKSKQKQTNTRMSKEEDDAHKLKMKEFLENNGFSNVSFPWNTNGHYLNFACDELGKPCPLCGETHTSNNYYIAEGKKGKLWVKNHSVKCKAKLLNTYDIVKYLFEREIARINNVGGGVGYWDLDRGILRKKETLIELYSEWECPECSDKSKFIHRWLTDGDKNEFDKMAFYPSDCPENVYNTWKGYDCEELPPSGGFSKQEFEATPFFKLLNSLTGGETDYALKWIAHLFKNPSEKPRTALIFRGSQGDGKGALCYAISKLMGNALYYETSNMRDIFGTHSLAFENRKLVVLNEADMAYCKSNSRELKGCITDIPKTVQPKYIQPYDIRNLSGVIFTSNDPVVVLIEADDRRYCVYHTNGDFNNNQKWFADYFKFIDDPSNQRMLYDYLLTVDVDDVDWYEDRYCADAYFEMKQRCLPKVIKWLEHLIVEEFPKKFNRPVGSDVLLRDYNEYSGERISPEAFGLRMKSLFDSPHQINEKSQALVKGRSNRGVVWNINREACFNWLKDKKYTMSNTLQPELTCYRKSGFCDCLDCRHHGYEVEPYFHEA